MSKLFEVKFNIYTDVELWADNQEDALEQAKEWFIESYFNTTVCDYDIQINELPTFTNNEE